MIIITEDFNGFNLEIVKRIWWDKGTVHCTFLDDCIVETICNIEHEYLEKFMFSLWNAANRKTPVFNAAHEAYWLRGGNPQINEMLEKVFKK